MTVTTNSDTDGRVPTNVHLLSRLIELQGARTDAEMAQWLGIERSHWYRTKRGERPLGWKAIRTALAKNKSLMKWHRMDLGHVDGTS